MRKWRKRRAVKSKKRKEEGRYSFWDGVADILFWVPELLILPFRLLFLLFRLFGRISRNVFDSI